MRPEKAQPNTVFCAKSETAKSQSAVPITIETMSVARANIQLKGREDRAGAGFKLSSLLGAV